MKCPNCGAGLVREIGAAIMGSITSEKKKATCIANGKKGGRPIGSKNKPKS